MYRCSLDHARFLNVGIKVLDQVISLPSPIEHKMKDKMANKPKDYYELFEGMPWYIRIQALGYFVMFLYIVFVVWEAACKAIAAFKEFWNDKSQVEKKEKMRSRMVEISGVPNEITQNADGKKSLDYHYDQIMSHYRAINFTQQLMSSGSWTSSLLKCLTYTSTSVMVIKIYIKVIVFWTLLWNQKDKDAEDWINDWGPCCNFFGRMVMQIPMAGVFLRCIWRFPTFCYNLITGIPGSVTSIDLDKIDRSILTPLFETMYLLLDWLVWKPFYWVWSFWSGCWGLVNWIYDLDNKWVVVILLGVIFLGDLCKASLVIQRLEEEQDNAEYKKVMKAVKKQNLSPGANPKKLKKYRAKNGFPKIENKPSELLALENNSKKTNNKTNQKVIPAVKYQEKKDENKIKEEVDDSCLEVCKMLINFCHDPKRKKEVLANIKKRGFADNDDIMKLINDACSEKGEAENDDRAKKLMDTIQKGKSKYYNQEKPKTEKVEKVYPPGINTPIEKQFHDIYDDVQKLDKNKLAAIKLAKIYDNIEALDCETEDIKSGPVKNNNTISKDKVKEKSTDKSKDKKSTKKIDGKKVRICWKCDKESTELWKCGGCRKAWYCNDDCLRSDWEHHGSFCNKMQEKRKKKNSVAQVNYLDDDEMD